MNHKVSSPLPTIPHAQLRAQMRTATAPEGGRSRHPGTLPLEEIENALAHQLARPVADGSAPPSRIDCGAPLAAPAARLYRAVMAADMDAVYDMLKEGLDPNTRHEGNDPPILIAARSNQPKVNDIVELFVKAGADVNVACAADGSTVLMHAVTKTQVGLVDTLLARPDINIHQKNNAGESAYMMAARLARGPFTDRIFDMIKQHDQAHPQG